VSLRLGLGRSLEGGIVANVGISDSAPTSRGVGLTLHGGPTDLVDTGFRHGYLLQGNILRAQNASGGVSTFPTASASWLMSRGSDVSPWQTDVNPVALSYAAAGSFGPGALPVPHLLTLGGLGQGTRFLDPSHTNALSGEGYGGAGVGLGTLGSPPYVYGARLGVGAGYTHVDRGNPQISAISINVNYQVDITSVGTLHTGFLTLTLSDAFFAPWAPRPR